MKHRPLIASLAALIALAIGTLTLSWAAERRARPPQFPRDAYSDLFFRSPDQAIRGQRPPLGTGGQTPAGGGGANSEGANSSGSVRSGGGGAAGSGGGGVGGAATGGSVFAQLVSPQTLEDEIKRVRLLFDASVTTPTAFRSGAFQDARTHLSTLAALFAVVQEHPGEVRWRSDAAIARDLLARTAVNCSSGTPQVYNEVRMRKDDLEDILSGAGLASRQASEENDWSLIVDRVPMMTYAEQLLDQQLRLDSRDDDTAAAKSDELRRAAEMMAVVGQILMTDGLIDADDEDYRQLCQELVDASRQLAEAIERADGSAIRQGVGAVSQSCVKCHDNYR